MRGLFVRFFSLLTAAALLAACGGGEPYEPAPSRAVTPEEIVEAKAYLEANFTPLPEGWAFSWITFDDDKPLRVGHAVPESPKATVLFVPGYTSSPELASDFMARWFELGFEVSSVDMPGQGGSVRRDDDYQKTYTGDFHLYGRALGAAFDHIRATRSSDGPLIVAGDSFGGHVLLRAAADGELEGADALFPLVPGLSANLGWVPEWLALRSIRSAIKKGSPTAYLEGEGPWDPDAWGPDAYEFCGDNRLDRVLKNQSLFITQPELRVGGVSNEYALGFTESGNELEKNKALAALNIPVTMITVGREKVVTTKDPENLCTRGMANCELVHIPEADHCLYIGPQSTQDQVHDALLGLLERAL
ncbi:MAG: alpha/beta fold hydrolase [Pseudomonadota bacterium]